ncbi:MAG: SDR family NAD(P)-dependent oxidoreductase [Bacteroidetes bacterium]|nr:SDR family NAD(P)-dependent oxidoreductase [Bacteroidota bacterium]
MSDSTHLQDKVVVVTGAGGRLGQRMVTRFTKAGARVISIGNEGTEDYILDLSDDLAVRRTFDQIVGENERLDVLIHAVGTWSEWPLLDTKLEDWEYMMRVNLTTAFLCFREAVRHMKDSGGSIIGIGARSGLEAAVALGGAYAASKAGLLRLIEAIAAEHPQVMTYLLAPSIIRYREKNGAGVHADDLVHMAIQLCSAPARALSGTALQAYGTR